MKTKLKFFIGVLFVFILSWYVNAAPYYLFQWFGNILKHINELHFKVEGSNWIWNDLWWIMIITNSINLNEKKEIRLWGNTIKCSMQLKWFYFNSIRWNTIRALDRWNYDLIDNFKQNAWLWEISYNIEWGFYSNCSWTNIQDFSIVWQIEYFDKDDSNKGYFKLQAGRKYNYSSNDINWNSFNNNFQLYQWAVPVWFIYDSWYWIGFVWGEVWNCMENIVDKLNNNNVNSRIKELSSNNIEFNDSSLNCVDRHYGGAIGIVKSLLWIVWSYHMWSQWNWKNQKSVITSMAEYSRDVSKQRTFHLWGNNLNYWTIINKLKRKEEILCRDKWKNVWTIEWGKINCIEGESTSIDQDLTQNYDKDTIIILKDWNLTINKNQKGEKSKLEVFIDKWLLIWNENNLEEIDKYWNYVQDWSEVTSWWYLRWNYFIRGMLVWPESNNYEIDHKLYIRGRLSFLNALQTATDWRKNLIEDVLWNSVYDDVKWVIKLKDLFKWRCLYSWDGTDGVRCGSKWDNWSNSPLIIRPWEKSSVLLDK